MKLDSNIWKILCGILFACLLAACKSPSGTSTSSAVIMKTEEVFFASVLEHTFQFNTLSARMKLEFSSPDNELNSRANLKMIYNDRLQLSIQPVFGIEMFRIEMNNDSIKVLDRMNKRYMIDSYDNLKRELDIDFNFQNLQALFTNQIFIPGEKDISAKHYNRFRMTKNNNSAELKIKDKNGIFYTFTADSDEKLLSTCIGSLSSNALVWDYNDFQTISRQRFPLKMTAYLSSGNITQGTIKLTFSSPEINTPLKTDFNIPSGYSRVTTEQIIKLLTQK